MARVPACASDVTKDGVQRLGRTGSQAIAHSPVLRFSDVHGNAFPPTSNAGSSLSPSATACSKQQGTRALAPDVGLHAPL